ncbi:hypothetical protein K1T71_013283 [Dendrolimus kikuchii]|uniref:Uncharacterized protein n=1 Tax=Dendrolimus kikuchii TaxID=765133 RepID=A0ACC1CI17_9NEOP|nr:hypothetical protein K1T71_013283 [Dendrolimus kikuchii]
MTSTNDGKDVKSNQSSGPKGKTYYIELFKSLEAHLSGEGGLDDRSQHLCLAWQRIHSLCTQSTPSTHPYLVSWLQKHTAKVILETEWWKSPENKDKHASLLQAINVFIKESDSAARSRNGVYLPWESQLVQRGVWFKDNLADPWSHPVLRVLLDPDPQRSTPNDEEVVKWLKEEPGAVLMTRLRQLAASKCDDMALALATAVMDRVRATTVLQADAELFAEADDKPKPVPIKSSFREMLKNEAGYTVDVWEFLTDVEFVLLHKRDKRSRCIELAKQTPLDKSSQLVERLEKRLEISSREKKKEKLWKNAKDVATLIAQVVVARCMVLASGADACHRVLQKCASALARLLPADRLPTAATALAAPAVTAKHLHTLAVAIDAQSTEKMIPFVCELYVRAITAGMNELERLKLKTEKESEARSMEQTLSSWFVHLGSLLRASDRFNCECILTAFSVHPSAMMYEMIKAAPTLTPVHVNPQETKEETTSDFGSWANDSRSQTNLVKTSETLNMKQTQHQSNVLSTAILAEGEALGLNPDLCQDIAVLLSGPRLKTLSWDMDRVLLLENCKSYMERTHSGTRALTTELKYLNLNPNDYQHLPEEDDNENDVYYGIEKGYEHLVEFQEPDTCNEYSQNERNDTALSGSDDSIAPVARQKKYSKKSVWNSDDEKDPLSFSSVKTEKKEHSRSKERSKHRKKKTIDPLSIDDNEEIKLKTKKEKKDKKVKKKVKDMPTSISHTVDILKTASVTDSDYDSQGKSSLHSNSEEIVYDGLYSMEELRSLTSVHDPVSLITNECPETRGKVSINKHGISPPTASNVSGSISKSVTEEVKRSLTRLIGERNNLNISQPISPLYKNEYKMPIAIPRTTVPIPTQINPKVIAIPEMDIPKSYIDKRVESSLVNPTNVNEPLEYKSHSTKKASMVKPVKHPLTVRERITQKQRPPKVISETACQNNFKNFLHELKQSINAGVGSELPWHKHKGEIHPVSRVIPVVPNFKSEPKIPQNARLIPQKKDETLNTFSRLSYMHKNKIDKKQSVQSLIKHQNKYLGQYPIKENNLDHLLTEHKQTKFKYLYPNLDLANVDSNKINTNSNAMTQQKSSKHPLLVTMLQSEAVDISKKISDVCIPITPLNSKALPVKDLQSQAVDKSKKNPNVCVPVNPLNSSALSVKDQNDLLHLLKQKNKLNGPLLLKKQVCGPLNKSEQEHNICKPFIPPKGLKIANASQFNLPMEVTRAKPKNITEVAPHSYDIRYSSNKMTKVSEIRAKSSLSVEEDKKPQTDWEEVMNKILAHKTPCRGPNALDLALNKTQRTCESLRNQRIKKIPHQAYLGDSNKVSTSVIRQVESTPKSQHTNVPNLGHNSVIKMNTLCEEIKVNDLNSNDTNVVQKQITVPKIINNKPKIYNIQSESPKIQNMYLPKKLNHFEIKRLSEENQKRQFTCSLPRQDDPFISGLPNSDYDLLEELMDDELRKEIGELSDDDFSMASGVSKDIKSITALNNIQMNKSVIIPPMKTDIKCEYANKIQRNKQTDLSKPTKNVYEITQLPQKKVPNVIQPVQERVDTKEKPRPSLIQDLPGNIMMNKAAVKMECPSITEINKNILNATDSSVYVIPPPTLSNVILVGTNIYNTYTTVQTQPVNNVSSNLYLNQPNISLYNSTQYAAPIMSSVIIGNAITVPTPILHQVPTAAITVPVTFGQLSNSLNLPIKPICNEKEVNFLMEKSNKNNNIAIDANTKSDKTFDLELNKNCERKVLSQVQEKNDLIKTRNQMHSIENNLKKEEYDKERLHKKRMSIISKMIYHGHNNEPIPLTYTPLKPMSVYVDVNVNSNETYDNSLGENQDSVVNPESKPEKIHNHTIDDVNNGVDTNENSKENNSTTQCRRILLRSSNKIKIHTVPITVVPKEASGRKTKVRLKENFTEKCGTMKAVHKKVTNTKSHAVKRLNKTLLNGKNRKIALKKKTRHNLEYKNKVSIAVTQLNEPKVESNDTLKIKDIVQESEDTGDYKNDITPKEVRVSEKSKLSLKTSLKKSIIQECSKVEDTKSNDNDHKHSNSDYKKVDKIVIRKVNDNKHEVASTITSSSLEIAEKNTNERDCKQLRKPKPNILPETKPLELEKALTKVKHLLKPPIKLLKSIEKIQEEEVKKITVEKPTPTKPCQDYNMSTSEKVNDTQTFGFKHKEITKSSYAQIKEPFSTKTDAKKQKKSVKMLAIGTKESLQVEKDAVCVTRIVHAGNKPKESDCENIKCKNPVTIDTVKSNTLNLPKIESVHLKESVNIVSCKESDLRDTNKIKRVVKRSDKSNMPNNTSVTPHEALKNFPTESKEPVIESNKNVESKNQMITNNKETNLNIDSIDTIQPRNINSVESVTSTVNVDIILPTEVHTSIKSKESVIEQKIDTHINGEMTKNNVICSDKTNNPILSDQQCKSTIETNKIKETNNDENSPSHKIQPTQMNTKNIVNSLASEIIIEPLPSPIDASNRQFVRVKLPNKRTYRATIYGKDVDIRTLFSDPTFKSRLLKSSKSSLEFTLNYSKQAGNYHNKTETAENIETVNLLSDDDEEEVFDYSFSTNLGKYNVKPMNKQEFMKHQEKLNRNCYVKLNRIVHETPPKVIEFTNDDSTSGCIEMLACDEVILPLNDCIINNNKNSRHDISELIEIEDSSNDSVVIVPTLNEDINTLKELLCKELCPEETLSCDREKKKTPETITKVVVKCKECFVGLERCDDLVKKYEQNKILNKKCVIELKRCDEESMSIETDVNIHNTYNNSNMNVNNFESHNVEREGMSVLSRSGSFSILNDFSLYDVEDFPTVKNENLKLECSSPVLEIYDVMATLCDRNEIKNTEKKSKDFNAPICDSDIFETKRIFSKRCKMNMNNCRAGVREKYDNYKMNNLMDQKKMFKVPSLTALIISFLQSNGVVHSLRPTIKTESTDNLQKHIPTLKRKYNADRSSTSNKVAKISLSTFKKKSNNDISYVSIKRHEGKVEEFTLLKSNNLVVSQINTNDSHEIKVKAGQNIVKINNSETKHNDIFQCYQTNKLEIESAKESHINYIQDMICASDKSLNMCHFPIVSEQSAKLFHNIAGIQKNIGQWDSGDIDRISNEKEDNQPIISHDATFAGKNILSKLENFRSHDIYSVLSSSKSCNQIDKATDVSDTNNFEEINIVDDKQISHQISSDAVNVTKSPINFAQKEYNTVKHQLISCSEVVDRVVAQLEVTTQIDECDIEPPTKMDINPTKDIINSSFVCVNDNHSIFVDKKTERANDAYCLLLDRDKNTLRIKESLNNICNNMNTDHTFSSEETDEITTPAEDEARDRVIKFKHEIIVSECNDAPFTLTVKKKSDDLCAYKRQISDKIFDGNIEVQQTCEKLATCVDIYETSATHDIIDVQKTTISHNEINSDVNFSKLIAAQEKVENTIENKIMISVNENQLQPNLQNDSSKSILCKELEQKSSAMQCMESNCHSTPTIGISTVTANQLQEKEIQCLRTGSLIINGEDNYKMLALECIRDAHKFKQHISIKNDIETKKSQDKYHIKSCVTPEKNSPEKFNTNTDLTNCEQIKPKSKILCEELSVKTESFRRVTIENDDITTLATKSATLVKEDISEQKSVQHLKSTFESIDHTFENLINSYNSDRIIKKFHKTCSTDCGVVNFQMSDKLITACNINHIIQSSSNYPDHEYESPSIGDNNPRGDRSLNDLKENISECENPENIEEINGIIYEVDDDITNLNETIVCMSSCEIIDDSAFEIERSYPIMSCNSNSDIISDNTHDFNSTKISNKDLKTMDGTNCIKSDASQLNSVLKADIATTDSNNTSYDADLKYDTASSPVDKLEAVKNGCNDRVGIIANRSNSDLNTNIGSTGSRVVIHAMKFECNSLISPTFEFEVHENSCDERSEIVELQISNVYKTQQDNEIDTNAAKINTLLENATKQENTVVTRDLSIDSPNEFLFHKERELKGIEYQDPELGTCYVFNVVETLSSDDASSDIVNKSPANVFAGEEEYSDSISECQDNCEFNLDVMLPLITYSRKASGQPTPFDYNADKKCRRPMKRKSNSSDTRVEKKYRKGKNIDYPKISAAAMSESAYRREYKQLIDYCSSIKFSYSRPFHKEYVDVQEMLNNWPIKGLVNMDKNDIEPDDTLFIDLEDISNPKIIMDSTLLTLSEEINSECKDVTWSTTETNEINFNMGFGEGSGRVIQNLEDGGDVSKFSAATLSDVKQTQPFLQSENCEKNNYSTSKFNQINLIKKYFTYINLKEKVRAFFQKTTFDLNSNWMTKHKTMDYNCKSHLSNFPFDLTSTEFFELQQNELIVNVVQVGQLPVSAAAQNPVTCDPRVTQVSDASPSQCSAENTSSDDPQSAIKTEYTELTTADLSLPLQDYSQHDRSITLETQEAGNLQMNDENIPIETEIKSIVKIELVEELPEEKEDQTETTDNNESLLENRDITNIDYTFDSSSVNASPDDSNFPIIFNSTEKQNAPENLSLQKQENGSSEKPDQLAHAMNAAGITTTPDTISNTRAHALVNMLSQKIRQGTVNVGTSQTTTNSYPKTSINAMALQQALAQILPPPLNQTNTETTQLTTNTSITPQLLHIVQGKNASGNQITLVDNTQQSVINTANSTPVLHIVQNKPALAGATSTSTPTAQTNTFSSLSLVDTGLQQGGNQLLHIVNTGNQKANNAGQLLKRVNLLTNLANVQGSNEQKMVQFVCKSADGKAIQLNAPHQRSMVLRLQPIESPNIQTNVQKTIETQDLSPNPASAVAAKEAVNSQQEIKSRSVYEENYAKFIQNSSTKPVALEKSTSLPKFNQAFGKQVFQDGTQKNEISNGNTHIQTSSNSENSECQQNDNAINLEHINQLNSPPLLLRKTPVPTSQAQSNLVQQIKQTIAPMNLQTMHGGVIYTRQIPVNIGGGQTINLITVPSTELIDDNVQKQQSDVKFVNQSEIEPSIIKIVPQTQPASNGEATQEDNSSQLGVSSENAQTPQPQPVLTQMRIKLPMLSKTPQMVSGARVVRPSFFQIQRNVIGGANHPLYQQLVLTAAPQLGQQTIRLPQTQTRNHVKVSNETQSSTESQMSSSTLEQLREFDLVLEQVKERSTVQPNSSSNTNFTKLHMPSTDSTDGSASVSSTSTESTQQVLYSIGNNQPMNVAYVNRKATVTTPTTSTFVRSPDSSGIADSPTSSSHVQLPHTVTSESASNETVVQTKPTKVSSKSKSRPKSSSHPPNNLKLNTVPPKTSTQKPLEDEQTTQRILYILAEYKEQVENSPDKDKPAPRRRSNPPSNPSGSSKRKKSSSGSRRPGGRDSSPVQGDDTCRTMGSEDSSCGTSQGDCNESCMETHSPQDSPRKVVRKLTFEHETPVVQPRPQPQRNVIVADGQTITVARGTAGKPATAVLMPANYILPVSMVKGGQQIAIVTNRGPKLLTVGGGEGGTTNALLLQRLIGPAGLKPVLARPGVRHVRLPTAALHNLQAFNLATATTIQPPDSTASPAPAPTPPDLVESRATSSPWTDRESQDVKPERGSSPEGSEPWNLPSSADPHDYSYEETVRADNMDRTVLVVQKRDGSSHRQRLTHVSAAALRHKYAILEHELRLQKSLSEECEDLGVDSPSASELFPEAELLFAASPAHDHTQEHALHSHTPQPTLLNQSGIPQPDIDDQIATDHLLTRGDDLQDRHDLNLGLEDVGIVTVSEDGMQATIALDQEEFARSHPNTTFHSEPTDDGEIQPFTLSSIKGRHITSTIFHSNRAPGTVLMTTPQTTVISQATGESSGVQSTVKYSDIDNMINSLPSAHGNINLSSVLVKDDGLTRFDSILNDSRELHLSNTASAIVHSAGNATQVIRRVCYDDDKRDSRFLMDEPDALIAGDDAKMIAEDSSREALESMAGDVDDDASSPERHAELFWESNSASERSESRRPLDFSSDSEKCCKSPSFDETNSTDSSGVGTHMRLDSVIKEARGIERSGSADCSSADDTHPPLRTYPPKRNYHSLEGEMERSMSGKTRAGERSPDSLEVRRRASGRGVVKRGCHCCNGSPAPPRPKKSRQRKPATDFSSNN